MARVVDLVGNNGFYIGEDVKLRVQVFKRDDKTVEDLSTWTLYTFTLKDEAADSIALFQKTESPGGISVVNGDPTNFPEEVAGASSVFEITITDADTDGLTAGFKAYQLKRMDAGNEGIVVLGTVEVSQSVSL
jgi:hypothetical protein